MPQKVSELTGSAFAILAIVAIVIISSASVLSLNPKVYKSDEAGRVAGINESGDETPDKANLKRLLVEELDTTGNLINDDVNNFYIYTFNILLDKEALAPKKIKVYNPNTEDVKLTLNTKLTTNVENFVRLELRDNLDILVLTKPEVGPQDRSITIPAGSSRTFEFTLSESTPIHFAYYVSVELK